MTAPDGQPNPRQDVRPPLKIPPSLQPGDRVALFSPGAHEGRHPPQWRQEAITLLQDWALNPLPAPDSLPRHLYLAGADQERAAAFQALYTDPQVKALFATRGGYGTARMLPWLDARAIAAAPVKAVVGMSDVSALFAYLHAVAGAGAVHGPCLAAPGLHDAARREDTLASLRQLLIDPSPPPAYPCHWLHRPGGVAAGFQGPLLGGNLTVLASQLGTPWGLNTQGAILFLEDVNEAPYRVDRCLNQFRQAARFEGLAGLVLGHFSGCDEEPPGLLEAVLRDLFAEAPFPVAWGLQAGHGDLNRALPLGRLARLSSAPGDKTSRAHLEIT